MGTRRGILVEKAVNLVDDSRRRGEGDSGEGRE